MFGGVDPESQTFGQAGRMGSNNHFVLGPDWDELSFSMRTNVATPV